MSNISIFVTEEWKEMAEDFIRKMYQKMYNRVKRATDVMTVESEPEVAPTPKEVIWTKNKTKLYRYISDEPLNIKHQY